MSRITEAVKNGTTSNAEERSVSNAEVRECYCCGNQHPKSEMRHIEGFADNGYFKLYNLDDKYICEKCIDDASYEEHELTICCECGSICWDFHVRFCKDNCMSVCAACIAEGNYRICDSCGNLHLYEEGFLFHNGRWICGSCGEDETFYYCDSCGSCVLDAEAMMGVDEECLCPSCASDGEAYIGNYHGQRSEIVFRRDDVETDEAEDGVGYIGVEIETDCGDDIDAEDLRSNRSNLIENLYELDPERKWFNLERDSSINGIEIVSQPCTLNVFEREEIYKDIFSVIRASGFSNKDYKAGMHGHYSLEGLGKTPEERNENIGRIYAVFNWYPEDIFKISERRIDKLGYCEMEKGLSKGKDYASGSEIYSELYSERISVRYYAFNICTDKKPTVEFRLFNGTDDYKLFIARLQFIDVLVRNIKSVSFEELKAMSFRDILKSDKEELNWMLDKAGI